jgi:hypothetical protein
MGFGPGCELFKYVVVDDLLFGEFKVLRVAEDILFGFEDCALLDLKGNWTAFFVHGGSVDQ